MFDHLYRYAGIVCREKGRRGGPEEGDEWDDEGGDWDGDLWVGKESPCWSDHIIINAYFVESVTKTRVILIFAPVVGSREYHLSLALLFSVPFRTLPLLYTGTHYQTSYLTYTTRHYLSAPAFRILHTVSVSAAM